MPFYLTQVCIERVLALNSALTAVLRGEPSNTIVHSAVTMGGEGRGGEGKSLHPNFTGHIILKKPMALLIIGSLLIADKAAVAEEKALLAKAAQARSDAARAMSSTSRAEELLASLEAESAQALQVMGCARCDTGITHSVSLYSIQSISAPCIIRSYGAPKKIQCFRCDSKGCSYR